MDCCWYFNNQGYSVLTRKKFSTFSTYQQQKYSEPIIYFLKRVSVLDNSQLADMFHLTCSFKFPKCAIIIQISPFLYTEYINFSVKLLQYGLFTGQSRQIECFSFAVVLVSLSRTGRTCGVGTSHSAKRKSADWLYHYNVTTRG